MDCGLTDASEDVVQLLSESLVPVGDPDVRDVGPGHVVAPDPFPLVVGTQPVLLDLVREAAGEDRVPGQLAHVAAGEFPDLGRDAVLLHQRLLGEVELERIVRGEGDVETSGKIIGQRGSVIVEEQRVVGEGRHGDTNLTQVVEIL